MALDSSIKPLEIEPVGWGEATSVAMEFDLARQFPTAQEANSTTAGFPPGVTIKGTAGAAAVGPEIRVNTTTAGFQHAPSVSGLEGGGYVVTWTDHVGNIQFQRYDSAGALVGAESQVAAPLPFRALESSSVDGLADGGFVVVWTDSGSGEQRIYRRQYDVSGAPIDAGAQVNLYDNDRQFDARVAALEGGGYVISWRSIGQDGSESGVYAQLYDASGGRVGGETRVNSFTSGTQYDPDIVALKDGGYLIVWVSLGQNPESTYSTYAQRFDAAGAPLGGEMLMAPGLFPSITQLADGTLILALQTPDDIIYFERFDLSGTPIGSARVDLSVFASDLLTHQVVALADGGFAIAYTYNRVDGSGYGVFTKQYDATGTPIGGRTQVNTYSTSNQNHPAIAALDGGGYVVVWDSNLQDGSDLGVYSQRFGPTLQAIEQNDLSLTINVDDPDSASLTVSLTVDYGFLIADPGTSGAAVSGSGTSTIVVSGSPAQVQALLGGFAGSLVYQPNTDAPPASATLTVVADDGMSSGSAIASILITPVNDAPSGADNVITILEDSAYVFDFTEFGFSDVDGNNLAAVSLVLSGPGTLEQDPNTFELRYTPAPDGNGDGYATISFQVIDDGGTANGGVDTDPIFNTIAFDVTPVNDAPQIQVIVAGLEFRPIEQQPISLLNSVEVGADFFSFTDQDAGSALLTLTLSVDYGHIVAEGIAGVTGSGTGTVTITASLAELNDLFSYPGLGGIVDYYPDTDTPPAAAQLTLTLNDNGNSGSGSGSGSGGALSDSEIIPIAIVPVNDAPSGSDSTITVTEDVSRAFSLADFGFTDVDGDDLLAVRIATLPVQGVLSLNRSPIAAGTFVTAADIGSGLLNFTPDPGGRGASYASFTFQVRDDGGTANGGIDTDESSNVITIDVALVDDGTISGTAGNNVITGTPQRDVFHLQQGGDDTANGLAGNDTFYFGAAYTSTDEVNAGDGNDSIILQGDYRGGVTVGTITGLQSISLAPGNIASFGDTAGNFYDYLITTTDSNVAAGTPLKINGFLLRAGEDFTFDGSAETDGTFTLFAGFGTELLIGGAQNDFFLFGQDGRFAAGDTVVGGAGYDSFYLRGDYVIDFNAPGLAGSFTQIESVTLASALDTQFFGGGDNEFDYSIIWNDVLLASDQFMTINGSRLLPNESMSFDGRSELDGHFRIFAGAGDDVIRPGDGFNMIYGGLGADELYSGGADTFVYRSTAESAVAAPDAIIFFNFFDMIDLSAIDADTEAVGNQAFKFIGSEAFSGTAGELRLVDDNSVWTVEGDVDGDSLADFAMIVVLGAGDFISGSNFFV